MVETVLVWLAVLFTSVVGVAAVLNAIRANKIKHGEIRDTKSSYDEAHA